MLLLSTADKEIGYTLCSQLSWSHNRFIMRVQDNDARHYYLQDAALDVNRFSFAMASALPTTIPNLSAMAENGGYRIRRAWEGVRFGLSSCQVG